MKRLRVKVFLSILLLMSMMENRCYSQNEKVVNVESLAQLKYNGLGRTDSIFRVLFSFKEIIDSIDEEEEVIRYYIEMDSLKSICKLVEENISGNSWAFCHDYRHFKLGDNHFLLYSKFGGTVSFTSQHEIIVYQYDLSKNKLKEDTSLTQRFTIDFNEFLHPDTPQMIRREIELSHDYFYHIVHNEKGIAEFRLYCRYIDNEGCNDHWKLGDKIIFKIEEGQIVKEKPSFKCYVEEK